MKPILFSTALLWFCIINIQAQKMEFGLKGGLNIGTPVGAAEKGATGKPGIGPMLGMYWAYELGTKWALHGEFLYSYKGSTFHTPVSGDTIYRYNTITPTDTIPSEAHTMYHGWVDGKFDNKYLDIPLYASYKLSRRFLLMFGGYVSYLLDGKNTGFADIEVGDPKHPFTTVTDEPFDQSSELNKWDYGLLIGTTYITKRRINFGLSLTTGLRSVYRNNYKYIDGVVRNVYMQTFVQFRIGKNNK
ncbi:MAG: PorT family protein [Bacteroidetes bacterium]|nr:PorT family protein [Bacteroidota bacterium]